MSNGVSNHMSPERLLNRLFRRRLKKLSMPRVTGICEGNPPVIGGFPSQRASNADFFPTPPWLCIFSVEWYPFPDTNSTDNIVESYGGSDREYENQGVQIVI